MTSLHPLALQLGQQLQTHQWRLATAESCTGGWVSQEITAIAGSSAWFDRGFITYSNQAKQEMLGVSADLLNQNGAVSESIVLAMAQGAIQHSQAQTSIAISGIAGPVTGGSTEKPVGTVWIGWGVQQNVSAQIFQFDGDRTAVRQQAVEMALHGLIGLL